MTAKQRNELLEQMTDEVAHWCWTATTDRRCHSARLGSTR